MTKVFRFHEGTSYNDDWFSVQEYGKKEIDGIADPTAATAIRQTTSIPSPFARMDLVKTAFKYIVDTKELEGITIHNKIVSDALDLGQMFFNFDSLVDKIKIIVWDRINDIEKLLNSSNPKHRLFGATLKLYLDQDQEAYNFDKLQKLYLLEYDYTVIGGTSPASLFFTSANDLSFVKIRFGNDTLFDNSYCPLYRRESDYQLFLYGLLEYMPNFRENFREVADYFDLCLEVLKEKDIDLFKSIKELSSEKFNSMFVELDTGRSNEIVEILGFRLKKKLTDNSSIEQKSAFVIASTKFDKLPKFKGKNRPLVLQNHFTKKLIYTHGKWDSNIDVPYSSNQTVFNRTLPGQVDKYPWLTVSDFLEPHLIQLIYPVNRDQFFDGNLSGENNEKGYLLPLKNEFFDYFDMDDLLTGKIPFKMETRTGGAIKVSLHLPIKNQDDYVIFERIYTPSESGKELQVADIERNKGILVENHFGLTIFPLLKTTDNKHSSYRIQLIDNDIDPSNVNNEYNLLLYNNNSNSEIDIVAKKQRNIKTPENVGTYYFVVEKDFDYLTVSIKSGNKLINGVLLPKWKIFNTKGGDTFEFALDFGTTNTHIEFKKGDEYPQRFTIDIHDKQIATLIHPSVIKNVTLLDRLGQMIDLEFMPDFIGNELNNRFPQRTVISHANNLDFNTSVYALADLSIPFYYEKKANDVDKIQPDLKWAKPGEDNRKRVIAFFEQLLMMIRAKVISNDGYLSKTKLIWFYPASMSKGKINELKEIWDTLFNKYISDSKTNNPLPISESIAPFYYYKQKPNVSASYKPVVSIDIGGGTSDIVIFKDNKPNILTSCRYAANSIFGDAFSDYGASEKNGFIIKYRNYIENLLQVNNLTELKQVFDSILTKNKSQDIIAFWFSLEDNKDVKESELLSFNKILCKDEDLRIVFIFFYSALMFHIASLMKLKEFMLPHSITFSGTGSKILNIITSDNDTLQNFTKLIFEKVYKNKFDSEGLAIAREIEYPKEVTSKGGLMGRDEDLNVKPEEIKHVYTATLNNEYPELSYDKLSNVVKESMILEVEHFIDFFFELNKEFNFSDNFSCSPEYTELAHKTLKKGLETYLNDGLDMKKNELFSDDKSLEETLFFYPIIGAINRLASDIGNKTIIT